MFNIEKKLQEILEFWAKDDYVSAYKILDLILEKYPENIDALSLMGHLLDEQALSQKIRQDFLFEKARRCYEKILFLHPDDLQATIDLGDFWNRKKKYENALFFYDKAISIFKCGGGDVSAKEDMIYVYYEKLLILEKIGRYNAYKKNISEAQMFFPDSELLKKLKFKERN